MNKRPQIKGQVYPTFCLLILALLGTACTQSNKVPPAAIELAKPEPVIEPQAPKVVLKGIDLSRVPTRHHAEAARILKENFCYCGCTRTVASCLENRSSCACLECSQLTADFVIGQLASGSTPAQVEHSLVSEFDEAYNASPLKFNDAKQPMIGSPDAPIKLVEFADFKCPHCATAFKKLTQLIKQNPGMQLKYFYFLWMALVKSAFRLPKPLKRPINKVSSGRCRN